MISVIVEAPAVAPEAAGRHNNGNQWWKQSGIILFCIFIL